MIGGKNDSQAKKEIHEDCAAGKEEMCMDGGGSRFLQTL
jgi:hypothetical protein